MAISLKEQIMVEVLATLRGITVANGFNVDFESVQRFTAGPQIQAGNLIMEIKQGPELPRAGPIGKASKTLAVHLAAKVRYDPEYLLVPEAFMNAVETDIDTALMADPTRGGLAEDTRWTGSAENQLDEEGGRLIKALSYEIDYRHTLGDNTAP